MASTESRREARKAGYVPNTMPISKAITEIRTNVLLANASCRVLRMVLIIWYCINLGDDVLKRSLLQNQVLHYFFAT